MGTILKELISDVHKGTRKQTTWEWRGRQGDPRTVAGALLWLCACKTLDPKKVSMTEGEQLRDDKKKKER